MVGALGLDDGLPPVAPASPGGVGARAASRADRLFLAGLVLVIALYQLHLGTPGLWGDEADTGNFARSVLRGGLPRALGGDNPLVYGDCVQLGEGFLSRRLPWVQYYLGAASTAVFGDHPAGLRRLFALLGALGALPLYALVRGRVAGAALAVPLCFLHPQVLLLCRQARYFPILVFLSAALLWLVLAAGALAPRRRLGGAILCALLLFHTHPLAALGVALGLGLHCATSQREGLRTVLLASGAGLLSYALFALAIPALPTGIPAHLDLLGSEPQRYLRKTLLAVLAHLRDLDYVGAAPALAWPPVLLAAWRRDRLVGLVLALVTVHILLSAAAIGYEGSARYAPLRYAAHLLPLLLLALYTALARLWPRLSLPLFLLPLVLSATGLSYWHPGAQRRPPPASFWPATYAEVLGGAADEWTTVSQAVRAAAPDRPGRPLLFTVPEGNNDVLSYYLGDRLDLVPDVFPGSACTARLVQALGVARWASLRRRPDLVLRFGAGPAPPGFTGRPVPFPRAQPDGARPELTRRLFPPQPGALVLYSPSTAAAPGTAP